MNWLWWIFVFFMVGGFSWVADTGRSALRTRHERRVERIKLVEGGRLALEESHKPPEPVCGCSHHLAKHDKQGKCHENVEVATAWDENKKPKRYELAQCNCQQYVGPQPLSRIYADEITDLDKLLLDAQIKDAQIKDAQIKDAQIKDAQIKDAELKADRPTGGPKAEKTPKAPKSSETAEAPEMPEMLKKKPEEPKDQD